MMLFEGKIIEKDFKKAKKYLSKHLNSNDIRVLVLYAKILLKEGDFKKSRKYFEICAKEGDYYSINKYAKMLYCGIGGDKNIESARFFFGLAKKSELYVAALQHCEKNQEFKNLPEETQDFLIRQIIKHNKTDDESNLSFAFKKIYMKYEDTQKLFSNNSLGSFDFQKVISQFKEITVEILFPSNQFKSIFDLCSQMKINVNIMAVISGASSISPKINIERTINLVRIDDSVQKIDSSSFENRLKLTEITIPSSVALIESEAFYLCKSLTHITIPSSVKFIGHKAFSSCSSLTRVSIDSPIISIEDETFRGCINLKEIIIPSSVISINQFAFCDCCRLKEIIIPTSVEYIKSNAFSKCSSLVQVKIPPSVCSIDSFSFAYCRRLKEISIPSSVNFIGDHAFYWCTSLEQITIPSSVQSIGNNAFNHCCSMKSISFQSSSSITSIETSTFELCSFTEITIPRSVYIIHQFAFKNCKRLKEVKFLNKLTKIESDAFTGCSLLNNKNISVNESQIDFKAVILGGCCTGKTNIFYRYINNEYSDCSMATVGVDFRVKYLNIGGNKVKLQIWDTGGKEIFHDIIRTYFNPNDFVIIVIDLAYDETFDYSMRLFKEIREEIGQIPVVVLLNKCDLKRRNQLVIPELEKIKKEYDFKYFEVSAKENINIEESINYIATETFNSYFS